MNTHNKTVYLMVDTVLVPYPVVGAFYSIGH